MFRGLRILLLAGVLVSSLGLGVLTASAQGGGTVAYVVQWGDYLSSIAARYGTTVQAIMAANNIANANLIYPGQVLTIPLYGTGGPVYPYPNTGGRVVHVVQWGENLFRIALRYGVSVQAIAQANAIYNTRYIYAGQQLIIPVAQLPQPQPSPRYTYTVQWGDYLALIAARYGTTVWAIMAANNLANVNLIYPGQVLVIP